MNLTAIAVTACIFAAAARLIVCMARREPAGEAVTQVCGAGLSAAAVSIGLAVTPYYLVVTYCPKVIDYGDTLKDPIFITISGIAYGVLGGVALLRVFQSRTA